jgi:lysyl-tRNA synthetase class 2
LIVNDDSRRTALLRPRIVRGIQKFCDDQGFVEVETSIFSPILGGAAAKPFITHFNALDKDFYLRIATELNLKKCMVGGIDRVYEIGRIFRNEGIDAKHNPEFTTIELYQAYGDLSAICGLVAGGLVPLHRQERCRQGCLQIQWSQDIDVSKPFAWVDQAEAIKAQVRRRLQTAPHLRRSGGG